MSSHRPWAEVRDEQDRKHAEASAVGPNHEMARGNRYAARIVESAGNIASGRGEYGLANRNWALASRLRREAAEMAAGGEHSGEVEDAGSGDSETP